MYSRNYTRVMKREKKIYSFSGTKISSNGLSYNYIKLLSAVGLIVNIFGIFFSVLAGKNFYDPFGKNFNFTFLIIVFGLPLIISMGLYNIKIQQYRLYEYILAMVKPKRSYTSNGEIYIQRKEETKGFIERYF